ncbi:MAG: cellobiose phosphorylase, partial [Anaerolineales bacterium]
MSTLNWHFIDPHGTFQLSDADQSNYLYFPLLNEAGLMSVITPTGHGDAKTGQNSFLLQPVSVEDLHNTRSARNFWVRINRERVWSATGGSAEQTIARQTVDKEKVTLTAGFLWHTVRRT